MKTQAAAVVVAAAAKRNHLNIWAVRDWSIENECRYCHGEPEPRLS